MLAALPGSLTARGRSEAAARGYDAAVALLRSALRAVFGGRADAARADLTAAIGDEQVLLGPEPANYRGSTGGFPKVKGNGTLVLTPTRLLSRMVIGKPVDVDLASVTGVSTAVTFAGSRVGGQTHLVLHTTDGDVAWYVQDVATWQRAIEAATAR